MNPRDNGSNRENSLNPGENKREMLGSILAEYGRMICWALHK